MERVCGIVWQMNLLMKHESEFGCLILWHLLLRDGRKFSCSFGKRQRRWQRSRSAAVDAMNFIKASSRSALQHAPHTHTHTHSGTHTHTFALLVPLICAKGCTAKVPPKSKAAARRGAKGKE